MPTLKTNRFVPQKPSSAWRTCRRATPQDGMSHDSGWRFRFGIAMGSIRRRGLRSPARCSACRPRCYSSGLPSRFVVAGISQGLLFRPDPLADGVL